VTQLNTIVSRRVPPGERAVLSVTRLDAGTGYNIIPETAFLQGTVRTLSSSTGDMIEEAMRTMTDAVGAGMGVQAEFDYVRGFPVVDNDPAAAAKAARVLGGMSEMVEGNIDPVMAGEDFSHYQRKVPGCFVFMGCGPCAADGRGGLHSSCFCLDEDCLPWGVAALSPALTGVSRALFLRLRIENHGFRLRGNDAGKMRKNPPTPKRGHPEI
jgi:metal-dependent amidase/aminoacylase/carboxypeptidase family protein